MVRQTLREIFIGLSIFAIVIVLANLFIDKPEKPFVIKTPEMALQELEHEYSQIGVLPGATRKILAPSYRSNHATLQAAYYTDKSWDEIRAFYLERAQRNDWILVKEGQSNTGITMIFQKSENKLYVAYSLKKISNASNLVINLTWNL